MATRRDYTVSGLLRHFVAEAARAEAPAPPRFPDAFAPPVPSVKPTAEAIAEAQKHLADRRQERDRITRRLGAKTPSGSAADGNRLDRLNLEIELIAKGIEQAERVLPRNGGADAAR
jgi:hypothetical protein